MGYAQLVAVSSVPETWLTVTRLRVQVWPNKSKTYPLHWQGQPLYCWEDSFPLFGRRRWWGGRLLTYVRAAFHSGTCCRA